MKKMDKHIFEHLKILFSVAYYTAKNNKPFSDFENLLELNAKLCVEVREEYSNKKKRGKNFVSHISNMILNELVCELKSVKYVSVILDCSTKISAIEELILHVRYTKTPK
jgi:hypothetical protein